jgi:hypothetical protein
MSLSTLGVRVSLTSSSNTNTSFGMVATGVLVLLGARLYPRVVT